MPDGTSSQDKLFSHSQSGETLNQTKYHHLLLSSLPFCPCILFWLGDKNSALLIHPRPAPCSVSEHHAHETLGSYPAISRSDSRSPPSDPWIIHMPSRAMLTKGQGGMASGSSFKTRGKHVFPWALCNSWHPMAD